MISRDPVAIVGFARTPIGGFLGELKDVPAPVLGATAIGAAVARAGLGPEAIGEAVMGCVLSAGLGQAPARQAALGAGLTVGAGATTVNKMCGSGMKAVMLAHDQILAGSADVLVAGGMESMSNAPYLLERARSGYRMGHGQVVDHMFFDGLEDAYDKGRLMGTFAEECATSYQFTREAQDAFAATSLTRAKKAIADGTFEPEIVPVPVASGKSAKMVASDDQPPRLRIDRLPTLKPAFRDSGTVTAGNSSSISDGAAALVLMRRSEAERRGVELRAVILGHATYAQAPNLFTTTPIGAIRTLLDRVGWSLDEVELFEINEAFAVVTMAAMKELGLPHDKVNIHGGACALGHPIGASGARILVTLLAALRKYGLKRGVASLCIGGGEATAIAVERNA
jgi:acetyl-CoA C-acetyltransferase